MVFQSNARKAWQEAKKKAGKALDEIKLKDGYGPMLDAYEKIDAKMKKDYDELAKIQDERLKLQQKLIDTRNDYVKKIERANASNDVKNALITALDVAFDKANHLTGKGGLAIDG
jgi:hypothetical protein